MINTTDKGEIPDKATSRLCSCHQHYWQDGLDQYLQRDDLYMLQHHLNWGQASSASKVGVEMSAEVSSIAQTKTGDKRRRDQVEHKTWRQPIF